MNYCVAIPTVNDATCVRRVDLLLGSLAHYEPEVRPVMIVVDGNDATPFKRLLDKHGFEGDAFLNSRRERGQGWLGRLTFGLWSAFERLHAIAAGRHILRLDTDALVIAPFAEQLTRLLTEHREVGVIGSSGLQPDGTVGGNWWHLRVRRMSKVVTRWEHAPYFRSNLFGTNAQLRRLIKRAVSHGYNYADAVCGGGYLLRAETVHDMASLPEMKSEELVATDTLTEDVLFCLVAQSLGWKVLPQNSPGDVFGVCWKGLVGSRLDDVLARGNAIIHSIKDHPPFTEQETQRFFAARMGVEVS